MVTLRDTETVKEVSKEYAMSLDLVTSDAIMGDYPKSIKFNPYNVSQMKKLVYAEDTNYSSIVADIINNLTDFDVRKLTLIDYDKLLLSLRINSCGSSMLEYNVRCSVCEKFSPFRIDLSELEINNVPKTFSEPSKLNDAVSLMLPRLQTKLEYDEIAKDLDPIDHFVVYIKEGKTFKDKLDIYNNLSPALITEGFNKFVNATYLYGVDATATHTCSSIINHETGEKCGAEEMLRIPFRFKFFFPSVI